MLLVIVAAGVALLLSEERKSEIEQYVPEAVVNETREKNDSQTGVGTLTELSEREGPLECSFTYRGSDLSDSVEGTFFLRNEKVRADFLQEDVTLGQIVTSYVLRDDRLFVWSNIQDETYGVQIDLASSNAVETPLPVPQDEDVRYVCEEWVRIDDSVFEIPSTVLFKDAAAASIEYGTIYEEGEF